MNYRDFSNNSSLEDHLRIALGVVAGLLGISVIILTGAFLWLRRKQKRHREKVEKSLSPSTNSSTSSLYISPSQRQETFPSSISTLYQLLYPDDNINKTFYRTDSFRQAVLSGYQPKQTIEHVSTKRDSFTYHKDGSSSPTFSTLEFIMPSMDNQKRSFEFDKSNNNNIYQLIIPPTRIQTYDV